MLRPYAGACALLFLPLAGCNGITTPGGTVSTVFEVEYANFAWVPTWRGFAIDSTGAIHGYDLKGKPWQPRNDDYPSREELVAKYASNTQSAGSVEPDDFSAMQERAGRAAAGPLSDPQYRCADAGTVTYSAWIYDAEQDAYRRVLLWREGDVAQLNRSADAMALADWLRSLQLVPQIQGCQPS
jgi:hypothetical protein